MTTDLTAGLYPTHRNPAFSPTADDFDRCLSAYDYPLPDDRIAQNPVVPRDEARLLVVTPGSYQHCIFKNLPELLEPGDLLVLNNTRVIPARLLGRRRSGSTSIAVEVLLLEAQSESLRPDSGQRWLALVKPGKRLKPGACIEFGPPERPSLQARVLEIEPTTRGRILQFELLNTGTSLDEVLHQLGQVPFPPYITASQAQPEQYQTIYASQPGAVAAPTAGLHFTSELLNQLQEKEVDHSFITLHVGVGTFRPVEAEDITTHTIPAESIEVPEETIEKIQATQARGGRVIAVGTTVARSLEAVAQGGLRPYRGKTELFIYPGYQWRVVEGLITNFHLPRSSLLMLVSALVGRQRLMALYQVAIAEQYRFYSFGDAMLILPEAKRH